jgi:hypothetical protein
LPPKEMRSTSTDTEPEPLESPIAASFPEPPLPLALVCYYRLRPPPPRAGAYIYGAAGCSCSAWSSPPSLTDAHGGARGQTHRVGRRTPCRTEHIGLVANARTRSHRRSVGPPVIDWDLGVLDVAWASPDWLYCVGSLV